MAVKPHPDFMKAGKVAGKVLSFIEGEVKPGVKLLKICNHSSENTHKNDENFGPIAKTLTIRKSNTVIYHIFFFLMVFLPSCSIKATTS